MFALPVLAAFLVHQGTQPLDQKVTFRCPATTADAAVAQLGKLTGTALSTQAPISGEFLVLRFKDVPLQTAMDKIAVAATGEWTKTESGYVLTRPGTMVRAIEHQQRADRIAALKAALAKRTKDFDQFDPTTVRNLIDASRVKADPSNAASRRLARSQYTRLRPSDRLTTRIVSGLGVEALADLPNGQRIVYSTRPTSMERLLGSYAFGDVQDYAREQQIWSSALAEGQSVDPNSGPPTSSPNAITPAAVASRAARILVICTADWDSRMISFHTRVADNSGKVLTEARSNISLIDFSGPPPAPPKKALGKPIALSPLAKELHELLKQSEDGENPIPGKTTSAELKAFVSSPEQHDPLQLFPSEPILASADILDLNVAACVQDTDFTPSLQSDPDTQAALAGPGKIQDGWFILIPSDPLRTQHEDRRGLGVFLRNVVKNGRLTLDAKAAYAQGTNEFEESLGGTLVDAIVPGLSSMAQDDDWQFLKLYGTLSASQRDLLLRGDKIPIGSLFARQQAIVGQIVFGQEVEQLGSDGTEPAAVANANGNQRAYPMDFEYSSLATEPTEILPNGLDGSVSIGMDATSEAALFGSVKFNDRVLPMQLADMESIAMTMVSASFKDLIPEGFDASFAGFRPGSKKTYSMKINLPNKSCDPAELVDAVMEPGPILTYDQLPADMKKQIQDRVDEMSKYFKDIRARGGVFDRQGQGGVPPPR